MNTYKAKSAFSYAGLVCKKGQHVELEEESAKALGSSFLELVKDKQVKASEHKSVEQEVQDEEKDKKKKK